VFQGRSTTQQAAQQAMEAELAAIASGKYDEPEPTLEPQLNFDDELAGRGLPRLVAPDSSETRS
jgi:hypothetical protein